MNFNSWNIANKPPGSADCVNSKSFYKLFSLLNLFSVWSFWNYKAEKIIDAVELFSFKVKEMAAY